MGAHCQHGLPPLLPGCAIVAVMFIVCSKERSLLPVRSQIGIPGLSFSCGLWMLRKCTRLVCSLFSDLGSPDGPGNNFVCLNFLHNCCYCLMQFARLSSVRCHVFACISLCIGKCGLCVCVCVCVCVCALACVPACVCVHAHTIADVHVCACGWRRKLAYYVCN